MASSSSDGSSLHSWVGIILYLPEDERSAARWRAEVDAAFRRYSRIIERELGPSHGATEHWAKVEPGRYVDDEGSSSSSSSSGSGSSGSGSGSSGSGSGGERSRAAFAPLEDKRRQLERRFGQRNVTRFAEARARLDPFNVMGGGVVDALFPHPNDEGGGGGKGK